MKILKDPTYIENDAGEKVPRRVTSINIEERHLEYLKKTRLNLSGLVRDLIEALIEKDKSNHG